MKARLLLFAMSLLAVGPVAATARTWTDSTGTFSVEAELVDVRDGVVRMKKPNGSVITVPIERLSDVDRKYLEDRANRRPAGPKVALVYADAYEIDLGGLEERHAFDIHKYRKIRDRLVADRLVAKDDFRVPEPVTTEQILLVQTKTLLENLKQPARVARYLEAPEAAMLPAEVLDRGVLGPLRVASGGTILAARLALEHGIAINLGGGYHHAMPDAGEGFCIYADMPIAIRVLQKQGAIKNVLVVDLDVHQGNGTAVCLKDDPTVFTFSIHQGDIYPIPKAKSDLDVELPGGTDDGRYMEALRGVLPGLLDAEKGRPELVFLQAGCDTLASDPLAGMKMTLDGIVERDAYVIDECVRRSIPVVMLLGGGYSEGAWQVQHASIRRTLEKYGIAKPSASRFPSRSPRPRWHTHDRVEPSAGLWSPHKAALHARTATTGKPSHETLARLPPAVRLCSHGRRGGAGL